MRLLIVKLTSLGDVVHALPAVTDAATALPLLEIDWMVDEAFAEIPAWHPAVKRVLSPPLRRWQTSWRTPATRSEVIAFIRELRRERYDLVIDAQGTIKSGAMTLAARGVRAGYDTRSIREPLASGAYGRRHRVSRDLHAVERIRRLFAAEFAYPVPRTAPDYGLRPVWSPDRVTGNDILLLHGATWANKRWPEAYWATLARLAADDGYAVHLPAHGVEERRRAAAIVESAGAGTILSPASLSDIAGRLGHAAGAVAVDTGLAHVAAALGVPTVTLFGPTDPALSGARGDNQQNLAADFLCAPCRQRTCTYQGKTTVEPACFGTMPPQAVWAALRETMKRATN